METRTTAAAVRQTLKAAGYTSRQVSVREERGTGSAKVTIKAPGIQKAKIEALAMRHECIYRDDACGEILSGSRFVFVEYADSALAPIVATIAEQIAAVTDNTIRPVGRLIAWRDREFMLGQRDSEGGLDVLARIWGGCPVADIARHAAGVIADQQVRA